MGLGELEAETAAMLRTELTEGGCLFLPTGIEAPSSGGYIKALRNLLRLPKPLQTGIHPNFKYILVWPTQFQPCTRVRPSASPSWESDCDITQI